MTDRPRERKYGRDPEALAWARDPGPAAPDMGDGSMSGNPRSGGDNVTLRSHSGEATSV